MSELRPIVQDNPTEREKLLISSAALDAPPPAGKDRVLAALGLATVTTAVGSASGATIPSAAATTVGLKWLMTGVLGGAVIFGAVKHVLPRGERSVGQHGQHGLAQPMPSRAAPESRPGLPPNPPFAPPAGVSEAAPETRPELSRSTAQTVTMRASKASPSMTTPSLAAPAGGAMNAVVAAPDVAPALRMTLADEVATLKEAQRVLAAGDPAACLRSLTAYDQRFERPTLGAESMVLRIEALVALGRVDEARGLGQKLLASQPDTPYARRIASALGPASVLGTAGSNPR